MHRANAPTLHTRRLQATELFVVTNSQYHLRNHNFVIPRFRTVAYGKHSLTYLGPVIWSKLGISIRSSESLDILKKRIKLVKPA